MVSVISSLLKLLLVLILKRTTTVMKLLTSPRLPRDRIPTPLIQNLDPEMRSLYSVTFS